MKIQRKRHLVRKKLWWEASRKEETKKKVEKYREKARYEEGEREKERPCQMTSNRPFVLHVLCFYEHRQPQTKHFLSS